MEGRPKRLIIALGILAWDTLEIRTRRNPLIYFFFSTVEPKDKDMD